MFAKISLSRRLLCAAVVLGCLAQAVPAVQIETVPVGNVNNLPDSNGYGAVDYPFHIGTYEVTAGQYTAFLNAVAATDPYGLYDPNMALLSERGCNIQRDGSAGTYTYSVADGWANRPVNYIGWGDAARFANWLHNGQPQGTLGPETTEDGAYELFGATSDAALLAVTRQPDWTWAITSEDEWYKAAYHKNDGETGHYYNYPTAGDDLPSNNLVTPDPGNNANFNQGGYTLGSPYYRTEAGAFDNSASPYSTFDQGGNILEWNEAVIGSHRGMRGGSYNMYDYFMTVTVRNYYYSPSLGQDHTGFRVSTTIPEPASVVMITLGSLAVLGKRRS